MSTRQLCCLTMIGSFLSPASKTYLVIFELIWSPIKKHTFEIFMELNACLLHVFERFTEWNARDGDTNTKGRAHPLYHGNHSDEIFAIISTPRQIWNGLFDRVKMRKEDSITFSSKTNNGLISWYTITYVTWYKFLKSSLNHCLLMTPKNTLNTIQNLFTD